MKNVFKMLVGTLALATALSACGKKGSSSGNPATPPPATSAAGSAGYVGANTWKGNMVVTDRARYLQFLTENGLCFGQQCSMVSSFFNLQVQTLTEMLPDAVNFTLTPRFGGYRGRQLRTQGDGYMNAGGNGFQVEYKKYDYFYGRPVPYGPSQLPYPQPQPPSPADKTLLIVLTYADATQAIANVTVQYQGVAFATGQMRGLIPTGLNVGGNGAPVAVPYYR